MSRRSTFGMPDMSSSSAEASLPLLLRLPGPLVTIVLQCLPLVQKLTECSRICRSFPRLEPAHFVFDAIDLQPHVMAALAASPSLLALLSGIPCVFLHDAHRTAVLGSPSPRESRIVHQPDKPPWFPRAQRASVTGMIERAPFAMLHAILIPQLPAGAVLHSSLSAPPPPLPSVRLPLLHTLRLSVIEQHDEPMEHTAASMQPLALLPLLRTLVIDELEGGMDYTGFRFLCSLPLAHLDLHGVHITPTATITAMSESDEALYPVTNTWSVLRLPTFDPAVWLTDAMLDTLLEQYITSDATAASGLRYISLETPQPAAAFARLAAVRTLRSMDVRLQPRHGVPTDTGALPVDALLSHQLLPTLPNLRHLRIRNNLPVHGGQPLGTAEQHVTPSLPYIQLLTAYSQQLRVLSLSRQHPWDFRAGFVQAFFHCSQLRIFEFTASVGMRADEVAPPTLQIQMPTLPHLHTLRLRMPVHPLDALMTLRACSATLQDYRQTGPFPLPFHVLRSIGRECRQLRRLECPIEADDVAGAGLIGTVSPAVSLLSSSLSSSSSSSSSFTSSSSEPLFPNLVSLIVHAERWRPSTLSASPGVAHTPHSVSFSPSDFNPPGPPIALTQLHHFSDDDVAAFAADMEGADDGPRLSDQAVRELAAIVAHAPIRYLDAAGVPLLSVHRFASLTQLRALRCQQSNLDTQDHASHVYIPSTSILPAHLHPYFTPQPTPTPQPTTAHHTATLLHTADLISDEQPVAAWQLDDDARGGGGGAEWAPGACQWFVQGRVFAGGMDGREAFMVAVAEMAKAGSGRRDRSGLEEMGHVRKRRRDAVEDEADVARKHVARAPL